MTETPKPSRRVDKKVLGITLRGRTLERVGVFAEKKGCTMTRAAERIIADYFQQSRHKRRYRLKKEKPAYKLLGEPDAQ